jgi:hypothetical protein
MVANGLYFRNLHRPMFWEQAASLVEGPRIWDALRRRGGRVAMLFWQQSLGESADLVISPAPIHTHGGGMVPSCYSFPRGLYPAVAAAVGREFNLMHYWGPLASAKASAWIADATCALLRSREYAPDLCLTYLPALDYDLQRYGPDHRRSGRAREDLLSQLSDVLACAAQCGYETLVFGDYAIGAVDRGAVLLNRELRRIGLFAVREVAGREYPDFHQSAAVAVADHEVAHVYVRDPARAGEVASALGAVPGVGEVLAGDARIERGMGHPNAGECVAVAAPGHWFAYPWWDDARRAPDYARHIDIHSKPGYDPCELFFGWPPMTVSLNTDRIRGSHGRCGPARRACWAGSLPLDPPPAGLIDLAGRIRGWLEYDP